MKYLLALLLPIACRAWSRTVAFHQQAPPTLLENLFMSSTGIPSEMDEGYWSDEFEDDPCWQNLYDDDCAMTNANLAVFKASVWVKSLPCAQGMEDCDMPEGLQVPEVRPHEEVDVMQFLNLKRAKHIGEVAEDQQEEDSTKP